ncbi:hypothetical protein C4K24_2521 [Pseudomonas chlororaphis subsp. aurantiaca]|nr:hypothetical protein C4K24_2521 [Pseudomonas chlororaphis subsp. aurantiaca]AZD54363.1 hypothetical protein C4K19_2576 [Pseudomonas chlororaphis subsp. aurantiaca]
MAWQCGQGCKAGKPSSAADGRELCRAWLSGSLLGAELAQLSQSVVKSLRIHDR